MSKCVCNGVEITCPVLSCACWVGCGWRLTVDDDPRGSKNVSQSLYNKISCAFVGVLTDTL